MSLEDLAKLSGGPNRGDKGRQGRRFNPTGKGSGGKGKGSGSKGKGSGGKGSGGKGKRTFDPDMYKMYELCYHNESGDLVIALREHEVVHVTPEGKIRVSTGGVHDSMTLCCIRAALQPFRVNVAPENEDARSEVWTVSDGKSWSVKLMDGMTLPQHGHSAVAVRSKRAELLLKNKQLQNPSAIC